MGKSKTMLVLLPGGMKREISLTRPHWQFYFIPRSCNLSSLEIDLAYRCVLFGQHDVLKNFELVANF